MSGAYVTESHAIERYGIFAACVVQDCVTPRLLSGGGPWYSTDEIEDVLAELAKADEQTQFIASLPTREERAAVRAELTKFPEGTKIEATATGYLYTYPEIHGDDPDDADGVPCIHGAAV